MSVAIVAQAYLICNRQLERRHFNWLTSSACARDVVRDIHKRSERILVSRDTGSTLTS